MKYLWRWLAFKLFGIRYSNKGRIKWTEEDRLVREWLRAKKDERLLFLATHPEAAKENEERLRAQDEDPREWNLYGVSK